MSLPKGTLCILPGEEHMYHLQVPAEGLVLREAACHLLREIRLYTYVGEKSIPLDLNEAK